jgi:translation initiation factor IF-1
LARSHSTGPPRRSTRRRSRPERPPQPEKEAAVVADGTISEALPNVMFRVVLDGGHTLIAHTAGKMRRFRIRMTPGDRVRLEMSPYDLGRGRIVYRYRE